MIIDIADVIYQVDVHVKGEDGLYFEWAEMYHPPNFNLNTLNALSQYFGTNEIDFENDIHESGCETCDYNSRYGFTVTVTGITKNNPFKAGK